MATASGHHDYLQHDILRDVATPQLYRVNAFRVLRLSVTVDGTQISRQQKTREKMQKLGIAPPPDHSGPLPLTPPPDAEDIRKAGQRLHDMQSRIVDELFWFWPADHNDGDADAAYKAACEGQIRYAHQLWRQQKEQPVTEAVAAHNLAVLYHALALDFEHASTNEVAPADPKAQARRDKYWALALEHWGAFSGNESGWNYILSRAEALDDPRLTSGFVRRLRDSLPEAILSININLAVRAAKRGCVDEVKRHLLYIRKSGFDLHLATSLLERGASPLVEQVRRICEPVSDRSKASPEKANQLATSVLRDCRILLTGIRALLGKEHHLRQAAFDLVASTVRGCMIDYGNATEDWSGCVPLLEHAAGLALDEGLQARLREDVEQVQKNQAEEQHVDELKKAVTADRVYEVTIHGGQIRMANLCTCCLGPATREQPVSYEWEETRGMTRYKLSRSFKFPICNACLQHQAEYSLKRAVLVLLAAGISIGIAYLVAGGIEMPEWLQFVLGGGALTLVLAFILSAMIRLRVLPEEHACRDEAVEMPEASRNRVVFRFHNPLYAEAFAHSNGVSVKTRQMSKPTRGSYILAGKGAVLSLIVAVILGGIGHSIIYAVREDDWQRSPSRPTPSYSPPRSSTPSPAYTPPRQSTPFRSSTGLSSRIDAGKARARALESEISQMDSQLGSLSSSIGRYKREIEGYESQARSGLRVNQYSYEQALANHNRLVEQYNALLVRRNAKCSQYDQEIDSVNDMVERYNRGER
jgi:hypothetical protein